MIFSTNLKGIMALLFGRHFFSKFVFCVTASNKLEHFFFGIPDWPAEVRRRAVHKTGTVDFDGSATAECEKSELALKGGPGSP